MFHFVFRQYGLRKGVFYYIGKCPVGTYETESAYYVAVQKYSNNVKYPLVETFRKIILGRKGRECTSTFR